MPGVWYDVDGDVAPGGRVVLTAHAEEGYEFADINEWATGSWEVAEDRRTAVRVYEFPEAEELCDPVIPGTPADDEGVQRDDPDGSASPGSTTTGGQEGRENLVNTGASSQWTTLMALLGCTLVAAGLAVRRRR